MLPGPTKGFAPLNWQFLIIFHLSVLQTLPFPSKLSLNPTTLPPSPPHLKHLKHTFRHWTDPSPPSSSAGELQGTSLKSGTVFPCRLPGHKPAHGVQNTEQVLRVDPVNEQVETVRTSPLV